MKATPHGIRPKNLMGCPQTPNQTSDKVIHPILFYSPGKIWNLEILILTVSDNCPFLYRNYLLFGKKNRLTKCTSQM